MVALCAAQSSKVAAPQAASTKSSKKTALPKLAGASYSAAVSAAAAKAPAVAAKAPAALPDLPSLPAVDLPALPAGLDLGDNALLIAGGAALLVGLPLALNAIFGGAGGLKAKSVPASRVLEALAAGSGAVLVDIRSKAEAKAEGSPDLRSVKKAPLALPLVVASKEGAEIDEAFGEKLAAKVGSDATLILLDSDGSTVTAATRAIAAALPELKSLYAVAGGAAGWRAAGEPWREPGKLSLPSVDLRSIGKGLDALAEDFKEAPTLSKGLLGLAAIGGASFFLINQVEALLELAGVIAAGQFALKLLFAEDREQTFTQIKKLVDEEVAVQDVGKDIAKIGATLLEEAVELQEGEEGAAAVKKALSGSGTSAPGAVASSAPGAATSSSAAKNLDDVPSFFA